MFVIRKKSVFVGKNEGKVATFVGAKMFYGRYRIAMVQDGTT